jgi:hypothetical protein
MVRPFSTLGERGNSALAATVAGIVKIQNAAAPTTAATTAPIVSHLSKGIPRDQDVVFLHEPRFPRDVSAVLKWKFRSE